MLVDIAGVYVESSLVAVVRESSLDSEQTVLFTAGQSACDQGFLIDMSIGEVVEKLNSIAVRELAMQLLAEAEAERVE